MVVEGTGYFGKFKSHATIQVQGCGLNLTELWNPNPLNYIYNKIQCKYNKTHSNPLKQIA